jgi:dTMP kinase
VGRGKLIAIEGIDGAGTTTQAAMLVTALESRGRSIHLTAEPSSGPVGLLIRQVLRGAHPELGPAALALLFAADRLHHVAAEIEPRLALGVDVVTDRFVYSSLAYQSASLDPAWVAAINREAPEPDLTLYLRVDPEAARARRSARGGGEELFDGEQTQREVSARYDLLLGDGARIAEDPRRGGEPGADRRILLDPDPGGSTRIRSDPHRPGLGVRTPHVVVIDGNRAIHAILSDMVKYAITALLV